MQVFIETQLFRAKEGLECRDQKGSLCLQASHQCFTWAEDYWILWEAGLILRMPLTFLTFLSSQWSCSSHSQAGFPPSGTPLFSIWHVSHMNKIQPNLASGRLNQQVKVSSTQCIMLRAVPWHGSLYVSLTSPVKWA